MPFKDISSKVYFNIDNVNELLLIDYNKIWRYNYVTNEPRSHFDFVSNFNCQPEQFILNEN